MADKAEGDRSEPVKTGPLAFIQGPSQGFIYTWTLEPLRSGLLVEAITALAADARSSYRRM